MQPRHNGRRARVAVHRLAAATADHRPTVVRRVHRARRGRLEQDPRRAPVAGALPQPIRVLVLGQQGEHASGPAGGGAAWDYPIGGTQSGQTFNDPQTHRSNAPARADMRGGRRILDPFAGSRTTWIAADMEGYCWAGIEMTSHYFDMANARLGTP